MPQAIDTVSGYATAPGATFTAWTLNTGDSLTVRNTALDPTKPNWLLSMWAFNNALGSLRVRSPKLHDNVQGIRQNALATDVEPWLARGVPQLLYPQDTLVVEQTGSSTGGQIETGTMLIYYTDLPGAAARLIDAPTLMKRLVNIETVPVSITGTGVAGYTAAVALNSSVDLLQANTDYALIGYDTSLRCGSVCIRGADTANLRVSGPGEINKKDITGEWFYNLALRYGMPLMPIFNSANKAGILCDAVESNLVNASFTVTYIFGQLHA